jgi:hypothetical protein
MLDMKRYAPSGGRPQFDDKRRSVQVRDTVTSVLRGFVRPISPALPAPMTLFFLVFSQKTFSKYPEYVSDPYIDAHVEYTQDGLYKGNSRRRPFVTYQNKTRTAFADRSMPVTAARAAVGTTEPATDE